MIVLDASALIEVLLDRPPRAESISRRMIEEGRALAAPHLADVEVAQVLRRYIRGGEVDAERARAALDDLLDLPLARYPHAPLLARAFELRENTTMYDAVYLALAEALGATLLTCDAALAGVPGCAARVEVVA
jgi:predicted nucleic acid-binding protein